MSTVGKIYIDATTKKQYERAGYITISPTLITDREITYGVWVIDKKENSNELPIYHGTYEVIPSATDNQTLHTAHKIMDADIKVYKIPYTEVSNSSNGITVTIGRED